MSNKLLLIKLTHSLIFWFQITCLSYILYAGLTRTINLFLVVPIASILFNGLLLLLNKGRCPFTVLAEKHGATKGSVTGIFLPDWVADNIFRISIVLFPAELVFLAVRYFSG